MYVRFLIFILILSFFIMILLNFYFIFIIGKQLYVLSCIIAKKNLIIQRIIRECDLYITNNKNIDLLIDTHYSSSNYIADIFSFIF